MKALSAYLLPILCCLSSFACSAQHITQPYDLRGLDDDTTTKNIILTLDTLFDEIEGGRLSKAIIVDKNEELVIDVLSSFRDTNDRNIIYHRKELINLYPQSPRVYVLDIAYYGNHLILEKEMLIKTIRLVAEQHSDGIKFTLPINYLTKDWQMTKVGKVKYFHAGKLNKKTARKFAKRNKSIATRLATYPESLDFYMCANYQEVLELLGTRYHVGENGNFASGDGVKEGGVIFAIEGNEDFSHDIVHYYSGKTYQWGNGRNWLVEEGLAYYWGNAYYVDGNKKMIEQDQMATVLNKYLQDNPTTDLLYLFEGDEPVLNQLTPRISITSFLVGIILEEVERQRGVEGIHVMLNCGDYVDGKANFFYATNNLIGLTKENFNVKVKRLLEKAK